MTAPIYHYGRSIRRTTAQLLDIFNEFSIKRYDPYTGVPSATIPVRIRFAPKEKVYEELLWDDKNDPILQSSPLHPNVSLPGMVLTFQSFSYAQDRARATFPYAPTYYLSGSTSSGAWVKSYLGIPVNMTYSLVGASKYYDEILQIYEQLYENFYPLMWVNMPVEELGEGSFTKWPISLVSVIGPSLITTHETPFHQVQFNFTVKGLIYKLSTPENVSQIYSVSARFWEIEQRQDETYAIEGDDTITSAVPSAISALSGGEGYTSAQVPLSGDDYVQQIQYYTISGI